jgi:hypothetical protein
MAQYLAMVTSPRFKFTATLVVSVLGFVLALVAPYDADPGGATVASAQPQRSR